MVIECEPGAFGDVRRASRYVKTMEAAVKHGSLVLRQLGGDRAGEVGLQRLLSSDWVTEEALVAQATAQTARAAVGRGVVLAIQDTSEINFKPGKRRRELGPGGHACVVGYFVHPTIAVGASDGGLIGLAGLWMWSRDKKGVSGNHHDRARGEKESQRWLAGAQSGKEVLSGAERVIVVSDRDGDIYADLVQVPDARCAMLTRACQNRALSTGGSLFAAAVTWPLSAPLTVAVERTKEHPARQARLRVRHGRVSIARPQRMPARHAKALPAKVEATLIEVVEEAPPKGHEPLHWYLLYSDPIADFEAAWQVVGFYRKRWRIEQVFQLLKSSGFKIEDSEVSALDHLRKLTVIGLNAAVISQQLVDARDGSQRPATDIIPDQWLPIARALNPVLEGKTTRQKNPHDEGSAAWLAWIIARLGGWNCYGHKAGAKTMRWGYERFVQRALGFSLARAVP